jgi:hypothetical protein
MRASSLCVALPRGSIQGALHCLVLQLDSIISTLQNRSLWPASLAPRLGEAPKGYSD